MAGYAPSRLFYLVLLKLNAIQAGGTPTATQLSDMSDTLDDIIQALSADGLRLWVQNDLTLPLVAAQSLYSIGTSAADLNTARPQRVFSARLRTISDGTDTPLVCYSRSDYNLLSNKSQTGVPNAIYYDPKLPNGQLYVYLVPDATVASTYEIILTVQQPLETVTSSSTAITFPNEWFEALKWLMCDALSLDYGVSGEEYQLIAAKAQYWRNKLEDWDQEESSVRFSRDVRGMRF